MRKRLSGFGRRVLNTLRKYLSVMGLWARNTFRGALGVIALMAAVELLLIRRGVSSAAAGQVRFYADVLGEIHFGVIYMAALVLMVLWLLFAAGGRQLTLGRLSVPMNVSAIFYALVSLMWLTALWAAQIGAALVGYGWYAAAVDPRSVSGQTLMLEFYRIGELRWLLPLEDVWLWVASVTATVTLAASIGADAKRAWSGGRAPFSTAVTLAVELMAMAGGGFGVAFAFGLCICVLAVTVYRLRPEGKGDDWL